MRPAPGVPNIGVVSVVWIDVTDRVFGTVSSQNGNRLHHSSASGSFNSGEASLAASGVVTSVGIATVVRAMTISERGQS